LAGFSLYALLRLGAAVALVVYLAGRMPWLVLPYLAAFLVAVGTLNNSQGSITHHYQAVAMTALALAVFHVGYRAWATAGRHRVDRLWRSRWELFVGQQGIAAAYFVSAVSKLKNSWGSGLGAPFGWFADARYFPAQLVKAERMHYYNSLAEPDPKSLPPVERMVAPVRDLMMDSALVTRLVLGSGLVLELFAFLILLGPRWNVGYALALAAFHLVVGTLMGLHFTENLILLAAFFIAPVACQAAAAWSRGRTQHARHR
jgi:hypothetical protein